MSVFPTAGSHVYRNAEGEVLGWDGPSSEELDGPDPDAFYERQQELADNEEEPSTAETYARATGSVSATVTYEHVEYDESGNRSVVVDSQETWQKP